MLDLKLIRNKTEEVTAALAKRDVHVDLTEILVLDELCRNLVQKIEILQSKRNELARKIGNSKSQGENTDCLELDAAKVNSEIESLEPNLDNVKRKLNSLLAVLPNLPDEQVPLGGKENNRVIHIWGAPPTLLESAMDHTEICKRLGLVDYERGTKLGGSGLWLYTGLGAAMEWALLDYFCQTHFKDGYQFFLPPHLLTHECGYAAGQFPKFEDDVFHLRTENRDRKRFLLPTAETAILNVYRDEILSSNQLPMKCFAYTPCYRRESGGARTEERGTIRGHQFNKVEMFQFVAPEDAERALNELVERAQNIMENLGLHYRTTLLAAEDVSASMVMTYDIEVWIPSIQTYKEVSSVSWAGDYQARRANIRYRPHGKKKSQFVHTLNGSGLATSRLFPAIVEQFQQPDGSVIIPKPLRKWMRQDLITPQ